jgi:FlaA1/EpsC-like NDP-sugar epimerase
LAKATFLSFLILAASFVILREHPFFSGFPRSTLFITYFFVFLLCGALRFSKRIIDVSFKKNTEKKRRALIAGAGGAGEQILRNILSSKYISYLPVGFVDDNPARRGSLIHGLRILGTIDEIPKISKSHRIDSLIIAFPSAGKKIIKKAEEKGIEGGIMDIKYLPPMTEMINSADKVGVGILKDIDMADLLNREPVDIDNKLIEDFIRGKKILVTGAAGSIGSELCRQIAKFNPANLLILDQDETGIFNISTELRDKSARIKINSLIADITDEIKIGRIFKTNRPQIIFHAAAYKHVPLMEENADEAVKNNIFGTEIVARAALEHGAQKFVFISTDKAVNPVSIMGATKRIGEIICHNLNEKRRTKFTSVRFGNVLGSRGSVIPIFMEQISNGGPIKITHKDMKRYFMVTSEACLLVLRAAAIGQGGEVLVLDMGNPLRIMDLAKELIRRSGFEPEQDINIEYIGSRPGEKLFEDILTAEEGTIATQNKKIFEAKLSETSEKYLRSALNKLKSVKDKKTIIDIFKELIPSFGPNN